LGSAIHGTELTLLILVTLVALLAVLAQRLKTPYPIVLVIGGLALGFVPVVPDVALSPAFVFLVILPPLVFASALNLPWRDFRFHLVSIAMLGLGLVVFTVAGVAVVAHIFLPGFDWRAGAVLGAVVSTTDTIAVSAIARRVGMPHQLLEIIEGESLINDATGLLALQVATALVVSGRPPVPFAGVLEFTWLSTGGVGAGLLVAVLIVRFERRIRTTPVQMLVSVATPYFAYLLAESIHASGVLATVACGLYLGRTRSEIFSTEARLDARAIWNTIDFALNGFVFIVIGLQLPGILNGLRPFHWPRLVVGAAFISALVILLRLIWMIPATRFSYFVRRRLLKQNVQRPNRGEIAVMVWSGMRGVLTLAAALSLPVVTQSGEPFPHRAAIIFLAFSVIVVTLVGQGLSLPTLIRRYVDSDCASLEEEERLARRQLLEAALDALRAFRSPDVDDAPADLLERYYRQRLVSLSTDDTDERSIRQDRVYQDLAWKTRQVQRHELGRLRERGEIREATLLELERELDLADLRWQKVS